MTYRVIHQGFDTLDLAIKGALAEPVLEQLEAAREIAETTQRKQMATIGPARQRFLVQPHGQRGGYPPRPERRYQDHRRRYRAAFHIGSRGGP